MAEWDIIVITIIIKSEPNKKIRKTIIRTAMELMPTAFNKKHSLDYTMDWYSNKTGLIGN